MAWLICFFCFCFLLCHIRMQRWNRGHGTLSTSYARLSVHSLVLPNTSVRMARCCRSLIYRISTKYLRGVRWLGNINISCCSFLLCVSFCMFSLNSNSFCVHPGSSILQYHLWHNVDMAVHARKPFNVNELNEFGKGGGGMKDSLLVNFGCCWRGWSTKL